MNPQITSQDTKDDDKAKKLEVTVHNQDDGDTYLFEINPKQTLQTVIDRLYEKKLRREPQADDRLTCEGRGEDVLQYRDITFKAYLEAGHCPKLVWLWVSGTGGA